MNKIKIRAVDCETHMSRGGGSGTTTTHDGSDDAILLTLLLCRQVVHKGEPTFPSTSIISPSLDGVDSTVTSLHPSSLRRGGSITTRSLFHDDDDDIIVAAAALQSENVITTLLQLVRQDLKDAIERRHTTTVAITHTGDTLTPIELAVNITMWLLERGGSLLRSEAIFELTSYILQPFAFSATRDFLGATVQPSCILTVHHVKSTLNGVPFVALRNCKTDEFSSRRESMEVQPISPHGFYQYMNLQEKRANKGTPPLSEVDQSDSLAALSSIPAKHHYHHHPLRPYSSSSCSYCFSPSSSFLLSPPKRETTSHSSSSSSSSRSSSVDINAAAKQTQHEKQQHRQQLHPSVSSYSHGSSAVQGKAVHATSSISGSASAVEGIPAFLFAEHHTRDNLSWVLSPAEKNPQQRYRQRVGGKKQEKGDLSHKMKRSRVYVASCLPDPLTHAVFQQQLLTPEAVSALTDDIVSQALANFCSPENVRIAVALIHDSIRERDGSVSSSSYSHSSSLLPICTHVSQSVILRISVEVPLSLEFVTIYALADYFRGPRALEKWLNVVRRHVGELYAPKMLDVENTYVNSLPLRHFEGLPKSCNKKKSPMDSTSKHILSTFDYCTPAKLQSTVSPSSDPCVQKSILHGFLDKSSTPSVLERELQEDDEEEEEALVIQEITRDSEYVQDEIEWRRSVSREMTVENELPEQTPPVASPLFAG